jgi:hypothetical protein
MRLGTAIALEASPGHSKKLFKTAFLRRAGTHDKKILSSQQRGSVSAELGLQISLSKTRE